MSYCRWSTDDFKSDVYVYESRQGFIINVAASGNVWGDELPPPIELTKETATAYMARLNQVMELLPKAKRTELPEKWAGKTFVFDTAEECAESLEEMKKDGLYIPNGVIDSLREDA